MSCLAHAAWRGLGVLLCLSTLVACTDPAPRTGSVVFIHPDGAGYNAWAAARLLEVGPDGMLNWDRMAHMGAYRSHQRDSLVSSSNAGATTHAYGVKAETDDYGIDPARPFAARSGQPLSLMQEAMAAGLDVGVVNSGHLAEPGTGVFLASAENRNALDDITAQLIASGAPLVLGGGESLLLPEGMPGHFGEPGRRRDGRNLIEQARQAGYTVVHDRASLLALPLDTPRVLGVFAAWNTFNDQTEEDLAAAGLPLYAPDAPSVDDMTDFALRFLAARGRPFFLVIEEEGSDNFGNRNNAAGMLEALARADAAIGTVLAWMTRHPDTLLVTASDSDAGGLQVNTYRIEANEPLPATQSNGAPMDGVDGTGSTPFLAAADRTGQQLPFAISWATLHDVHGGVIAKAHGLNAERLPANVDNTELYRLMYGTLFGRWLD